MDGKLEIQKSLIISAKSALIFKVLADVQNWNTWTASVKKTSLVKGTSFAIGTQVKIVQPKLPSLIWEITEIRDNNSFTWISKSPGLKMIAKHIVEEAGDYSIVRLITIYQGFLSNIIFNLTSGLTDKYMTMEVHGLKQATERLVKRPRDLDMVPVFRQ